MRMFIAGWSPGWSGAVVFDDNLTGAYYKWWPDRRRQDDVTWTIEQALKLHTWKEVDADLLMDEGL